MAYSTAVLKTKADCDAVLNMAHQDKDFLLVQQTNLERQVKVHATTSVEVESELKTVNAELDFLAAQIPTIEDQSLKENKLKDQSKLQYRQRVLLGRKVDYGALSLLDREFSLERVKKELQEADNFITTIENHKSGLSS